MVRFAAPFFMAIVEIEENFANVAAMAGMASGDVGASDRCGHFGAQFVDELLDELAVGREADERWNADWSVCGHKQSGAC